MTNAISSFALVLSAVALAACSQAPTETPPPTTPVVADDPLIKGCGPVTDVGFCGVIFGMTLAEARAVFPEPLESFASDPTDMDPESLSCFMIFPKGRPKDLTFMLVDGKVARVDISVAGIATNNGSQVGSSEEEILANYGDRAKVFPNKYDDRKHDVVVDTRFLRQLIFESDGSKVLNYRAGVLPPVGYIERCL